MANPSGCFRIVVEFGITFFLPLFSKLSNVARLLFQGFIITSGNFPDHICITHLNRYHKHVVKIYVQKRYISLSPIPQLPSPQWLLQLPVSCFSPKSQEASQQILKRV